MGVVNGISSAEGTLNADMAAATTEEAKELATNKFTTKIAELMNGVKPESLIIIGIWVLAILVLCFVAVFLLIRFGYKVTEEKHIAIVAELEKRHAEAGFNSEEVEQPVEAAVEELPEE